MADYSSTTRLTLGLDALRSGSGDKLLRAVQRAVAADYEVLGEMGRGAQGRIVYLAREAATRHLVALQLSPPAGNGPPGEMWLDVLRTLDASVPSGDDKCPRCGQQLRGWGRFCSQCGVDLSGVAPGSGHGTSMDQLLAAVKEAAGHRYEVLGQMARAEGGGVVYFARERATGQIAALRLQRRPPSTGGPDYDLGKTMVLKSVVEAMAGPASSPAGDSPVAAVDASAAAAEPAPAPSQVPVTFTWKGRDWSRFAPVAVALLLLFGGWLLLRRAPTPRPAARVCQTCPPRRRRWSRTIPPSSRSAARCRHAPESPWMVGPSGIPSSGSEPEAISLRSWRPATSMQGKHSTSSRGGR